MTSGISTMSREIVLGTVHKFDWVQLGSAINHPDRGQIINLDEDIRNRTGVSDASVKLIPSAGYGDIHIIRELLKIEKPDAILHFTDPHYWQWLYDNEHEIRQQVPLLFYHIWDDLPDPLYNRDYYESCDWIACISKQTYGIVNRVGKSTLETTYQPLKDWQIKYVPHGINPNIFKPLDEISKNTLLSINKDNKYDFILFFNNRNVRRKQPSDVIYAYKLFCDKLSKENSKKCLLLMHTQMVDENGTDLPAVVEALCPDYDVAFRLEQNILNEIYNLVDCTINIANNEGFGLSTAESLMAGTPIIVNVTGGLQDQCGFKYNAEDYITIGSLHQKKKHGHERYGEWVNPVWSVAHNINGSIPTPYIFDDRVNTDDVADAIMDVYNKGKNENKRRGLLGREWMINNLSSNIMNNLMIEGIETALENYKPKERYNLFKIS